MRFCLIAALCCIATLVGAADEFPLSIAARKAMMGGGYVLIVTNQSAASVRVQVTALNKKIENVVDAKTGWELGHMEGFPFADQDTAKVTFGTVTRTYQFAAGRISRLFENQAEKQAWVADFLRKQVFAGEVQFQAKGVVDLNQNNIGEYGTLPELVKAKVLDADSLAVPGQLGFGLVSLMPMTGTAWAVMPSQDKFDSDGIKLREGYWLVVAVPNDSTQPSLLIANDGQVRTHAFSTKDIGPKELLATLPLKDGIPDLSAWALLAR